MRAIAKVFTTGRSQAIRLPVEFRFDAKEVYIDRDPRTGNIILSRRPAKWGELFVALDNARGSDDFLEDRDKTLPQEREIL